MNPTQVNIDLTRSKLTKPLKKGLRGSSYRCSKRLQFMRTYVNRRVKKNPVLDLGCREGNWLRRLKKEDFHHLYGIDICPEAIELIDSDTINASVGDIEEPLGFSNKFSLVTMFHVLEHTENPATALSNVKDSMMPKGLLLIEMPLERAESPRHEVGHFSLFKKPEDLRDLLTGFDKLKQGRIQRDLLMLVRKK